jgi:hypothetical protein
VLSSALSLFRLPRTVGEVHLSSLLCAQLTAIRSSTLKVNRPFKVNTSPRRCWPSC